ncbi:MAG: 16S rRNA (guanine(966)-N(2))-methyltransferase RsmD [Oligoflexia bacterium]|nr:16S rRNA (guanine(966)-N(2))-methyltransferase RsmD [Oligoflexia bacterium]
MRIISGKFKGHRLVTFDKDHIRPTTDRVKESLFNIIAVDVEGARVLDLYAGTGNLSWEALSRGAHEVVMVESSIKSIQIIRQNQTLLKIDEGVEIVKDEAIHFLDHYVGNEFDLVFIDPPFPSKICIKTLEALSKSTAATTKTRVMIEHSKHEPLPDEVGGLRRVDSRNYGDKLLAFYQKCEESNGS